jgi:hypothetical protein
VFEEWPSRDECEEETQDWIEGGEWGIEGASIDYWWILYDENNEGIASDSGTVEIEPDHEQLIRNATRGAGCGDDPADHEWNSEGEGGCTENPGVWSTGGTSMVFQSHCEVCGLRRTVRTCGSQRNPGEHDTVEYEMPSEEEVSED